jgi:hypothetical protein
MTTTQPFILALSASAYQFLAGDPPSDTVAMLRALGKHDARLDVEAPDVTLLVHWGTGWSVWGERDATTDLVLSRFQDAHEPVCVVS